MRRLCLWFGHCFGRITPERTLRKLVRDAREAEQKHRVLALENEALATRATIAARHSAEWAHHYQSTAFRLSSIQDQS